MRKITALILICFFMVLYPKLNLQADENFDIRHYDVSIIVDSKNHYHITETIEVEFYNPRHGIYRDIPTFHDGYSHPVKNITVSNPDTGKDYKTSISKSSDQINIRIGDADLYVTGFMTYVIDYTYESGMDYNKDQDEFYHNIIGDEWYSTIDKVTFDITMPYAFDPNRVNITSGYYGSTDTSNIDFSVDGLTITGETFKPLYMENVTVALPLPEGYYDDVNTDIKLIGLYLILIISLMVAISAFVINRKYKSQNLIVPVIHFAPPEDLNPAELAYVYGKESLYHKDVATLVLSWASEGYLKIVEVKNKLIGSHMSYHKLQEMPPSKPRYERDLFKKMFNLGTNDVVTSKDLENVFYTSLQTAVSKIKLKFLKEKEVLVNQVQLQTKLFSAVYTLVFILVFAAMANGIVHNGFWVNLIPIAVICITQSIFAGVFVTMFKKSVTTLKVIGAMLLSLIPLILTVLFLLGIYTTLLDLISWQNATGILLVPLSIFLFFVAQLYILSTKDYTPYSRDLLGKIEGFRTFLKTAKTDQIKVLYEENPEYIYSILPYAMVLDLTSIWEKHVTKMSAPSPSWYYGSSAFHAASFTRSMNHSLSSVRSQPSSSGSGGSSSGGFSGGGGGGGGGGSW